MADDSDNSFIEKCPSCDINFHGEKPICFYCYYRGKVGVAKFLLFKAMKESGNEYVTVEEAMVLVNKLRIKLGKPVVKRDAVYKILRRYSENYTKCKNARTGYLVLVKKEKCKRGRKLVPGKPTSKYKLSKRLERRVEKYEKNWMLGLPINIRVKRGRFSYHTKYNANITMIRQKLARGDYPPFKYLMP